MPLSLSLSKLLLFIGVAAFLSAEEKNSPSKKDDNWLQKNIEEQKKLQENQRADSDSKINPFQAIQKPNDEKPKSTEPFTLINNKERPESKTPAKIEPPRPMTTDTTFKPAISGFTSDAFYQQRRENQSRDLVEQMESSHKKSDDSDPKEEDQIEKMRREKLQKSIDSKANDKLFDQSFNMPFNPNHPQLDADRKNPYLQQNQNPVDRERDRLSSDSVNRLPTIQMVKPIETPQMIENPALNRSVFESQNSRQPNQGTIYNQMMTVPGTGKSRIQDPNDFLKR